MAIATTRGRLQLHLRRVLSLSSVYRHRLHTTSTFTPLSSFYRHRLHTISTLTPLSSFLNKTPSLQNPPSPYRFFHFSQPSLANAALKEESDFILFQGCDYNHWLIVMDFGKDPKDRPPYEQMVETYVQTLAKVVGSVEEAKKKIYGVSTTPYTGFHAEIDEETSKKLEDLPGVIDVLPDSYIDPVNKEYGGDKYINGTIIPRHSPVQREIKTKRQNDQRSIVPRPSPVKHDEMKTERQNGQMTNQQGIRASNQHGSMSGEGRGHVSQRQIVSSNYDPTGEGGRDYQSGGNPYAPPQQGSYNQGIPSHQGNVNQAMPLHQGNLNQGYTQLHRMESPGNLGSYVPQGEVNNHPGNPGYNNSQGQMRNFPGNHGNNSLQEQTQYLGAGRNYGPASPMIGVDGITGVGSFEQHGPGRYGQGLSGNYGKGGSAGNVLGYTSQVGDKRFLLAPSNLNTVPTEQGNYSFAAQAGMNHYARDHYQSGGNTYTLPPQGNYNQGMPSHQGNYNRGMPSHQGNYDQSMPSYQGNYDHGVPTHQGNFNSQGYTQPHRGNRGSYVPDGQVNNPLGDHDYNQFQGQMGNFPENDGRYILQGQKEYLGAGRNYAPAPPVSGDDGQTGVRYFEQSGPGRYGQGPSGNYGEGASVGYGLGYTSQVGGRKISGSYGLTGEGGWSHAIYNSTPNFNEGRDCYQSGGNTFMPPQQGNYNQGIPFHQENYNQGMPSHQGNYDHGVPTHQRNYNPGYTQPHRMEIPGNRGSYDSYGQVNNPQSNHVYNQFQGPMRHFPENHGSYSTQLTEYPHTGRNYAPTPPVIGADGQTGIRSSEQRARYGQGPSGNYGEGVSAGYGPVYASQVGDRKFSDSYGPTGEGGTSHAKSDLNHYNNDGRGHYQSGGNTYAPPQQGNYNRGMPSDPQNYNQGMPSLQGNFNCGVRTHQGNFNQGYTQPHLMENPGNGEQHGKKFLEEHGLKDFDPWSSGSEDEVASVEPAPIVQTESDKRLLKAWEGFVRRNSPAQTHES